MEPSIYTPGAGHRPPVLAGRDALIQAIRQHREILEALLRRDRPAAERALVNHIRNNHPLANRPNFQPREETPI